MVVKLDLMMFCRKSVLSHMITLFSLQFLIAVSNS